MTVMRHWRCQDQRMPQEIGWEWKTTGWWVRPKNAREVMTIIGSIGVHSVGQHFAWRGMSSADYSLNSSLHRKVGGDEERVREVELDLIKQARAWGLGIQPTGHVDDLQLLSDLQHYGVATRLIDFSSNPMTALWFACQSPKATGVSKSGLLLALNITNWERLSTVRNPGPGTYDEMGDPTGARLAAALARGKPFIVESANPNERLRAQEGFFVAGPVPHRPGRQVGRMTIVQVTPFESIDVPYRLGVSDELYRGLLEERGVGAPGNLPFVAIIISAGLKRKLLSYLEGTYNRSARVLFPDYAGFLEFGNGITQRDAVS